MFLADYKRAYPDALMIGPDGIQAKLDAQGKGGKLDGTYYKDAEGTKYGFENEACAFTGGKVVAWILIRALDHANSVLCPRQEGHCVLSRCEQVVSRG